jgi:hypothetical protein
MGNLPDLDAESLESINKIVNAEGRQRFLERADEIDKGHTLGICCDNCQGKMFTSFGTTRQKRKEAPGYVTLVYLHCARCGEMIFLVCQSTLFTPMGEGRYKPHWNAMGETHDQITQASLRHLAALESHAENEVKKLIDWM